MSIHAVCTCHTPTTRKTTHTQTQLAHCQTHVASRGGELVQSRRLISISVVFFIDKELGKAGLRWRLSDGVSHHGFAPQAAPVLEPQHAAARLIAHRTLGTDRKVPFQPLVWHCNLKNTRTHAQINTRVQMSTNRPTQMGVGPKDP